MPDGARILTEAEWEVFAIGLDSLRDGIEADIAFGTDMTEAGVDVFDRLTPEQKLALLADVASAQRDPGAPAPAPPQSTRLRSWRSWPRSATYPRGD